MASKAQKAGGHPQAAQGLAREKASVYLKIQPITHKESVLIERTGTQITGAGVSRGGLQKHMKNSARQQKGREGVSHSASKKGQQQMYKPQTWKFSIQLYL